MLNRLTLCASPGSDPPIMIEPLQFDSSVGRIISNPQFGNAILMCIVTNCVFMSMEYYEQPDSWTDMIAWAEVAFFFIFLSEMIVKWIGSLLLPHLLPLSRPHYFPTLSQFAHTSTLCVSLPTLPSLHLYFFARLLYVEINGIQDLKICSHAASLILSLSSC